MLILERKVGESVKITDEVTITVVKGRKGRMKLAIDAPGWIKVTRGELYAIQRDQRTPDGRD